MVRVSQVQRISTLAPWPRLRSAALGLVAVALLAGCTQTYATREANNTPVEAKRATAELADRELLDVRVRTFVPGPLSEDKDASRGLTPEIREAEGHFSAIQLKNTMEESGYWGAVRVVPEKYEGGEVLVSGTVLQSDGEILKLEVTVTDATGVEWFTRDYEGVVDAAAYSVANPNNEDAFDFLYTQISNDIALYRAELAGARVDEIRQVAELRFAAEFAPEAFKDFVKTDEEADPKSPLGSFLAGLIEPADGLDPEEGDAAAAAQRAKDREGPYRVVRLPASDDPMIDRVRRIKAREDLVVDALDQQYESLSRRINRVYTQWRVARLTEMNAIREVEDIRDAQTQRAIVMGVLGVVAGVAIGSSCNNCGSAGAIVGGVFAAEAAKLAIRAGDQASANEKIHKAALEELGQSLAADVEPIVVEVEGESVALQGDAEAKFGQWRELMKELYRREVGTLDDAPVKASVPADMSNRPAVQPIPGS